MKVGTAIARFRVGSLVTVNVGTGGPHKSFAWCSGSEGARAMLSSLGAQPVKRSPTNRYKKQMTGFRKRISAPRLVVQAAAVSFYTRWMAE